VTEQLHPPKSAALRDLYWRSEILQVLYWLRGEGLGEVADAELIERFLGVDAGIGVTYLERLVAEGYLERQPGGFRLSGRGMEEGAEEFAASFADITRPAHGECSADCWCHVSVEEAEACAEERAGHQHPH
jgi:hypothetical protein